MVTIAYLLQSKYNSSAIYLKFSVDKSILYKRKTGLFIDWKVG